MAKLRRFGILSVTPDPALIEAVRQGRKEEFAAFDWPGEPPDPLDEATFVRARLDHQLRRDGSHKVLWEFYRELLRLRRELNLLTGLGRREREVKAYEEEKVLWMRMIDTGGEAVILFSFGPGSLTVFSPGPRAGGTSGWMPPRGAGRAPEVTHPWLSQAGALFPQTSSPVPAGLSPPGFVWVERTMTGFRVPAATYRLQFPPWLPLPQRPGPGALFARPRHLRPLRFPLLQGPPAQPPRLFGNQPAGNQSGAGVQGLLKSFEKSFKIQGHGPPVGHCSQPHGPEPYNSWWLDVLENGPGSPYAMFFDIDWHPFTGCWTAVSSTPCSVRLMGRPWKIRKSGWPWKRRAFLFITMSINFPWTPRLTSSFLKHRLADLVRNLGRGIPRLRVSWGSLPWWSISRPAP